MSFVLVAFVTFLRKSNLVPCNPRQISPKVIMLANLAFTSSGANIHVSATKTIQCHQCLLKVGFITLHTVVKIFVNIVQLHSKL